MNPFHAEYETTQNYANTKNNLEPAVTLNGVSYPHFHRGVDMVGPSANCPIYAVVPGKVYACGTDIDGANYVIELTDTGYYACYWHLSKITVFKGQRIDNSVQVGLQGMTGNATGNHLHLEVELPGAWKGLLQMTPTDPMPFINDTPTGGQVMDLKEVARGLYRVLIGPVPSDDIIQQKVDYMAKAGTLDQVATDLRNINWVGKDQLDTAAAQVTDLQTKLKDQTALTDTANARAADSDKKAADVSEQLGDADKEIATLEESLKQAQTTNPTAGWTGWNYISKGFSLLFGGEKN